jgi:hypothetical protein
VANKFLKDNFDPQNPAKYVGSYPIVYRSSWELKIMQKFDTHPDVVSWASESIKIPYIHPLTGKPTIYIPDFMVTYSDAKGNLRCEMIECKPLMEVPGMPTGSGKSSRRAQLIQIVNQAKWKAARSFCTKRRIYFRVMTEDQIFYSGK